MNLPQTSCMSSPESVCGLALTDHEDQNNFPPSGVVADSRRRPLTTRLGPVWLATQALRHVIAGLADAEAHLDD